MALVTFVIACGMAALEEACGPAIRRHWHRAYDAMVNRFRRTPPHLCGMPMECGEGTLSETQVREEDGAASIQSEADMRRIRAVREHNAKRRAEIERYARFGPHPEWADRNQMMWTGTDYVPHIAALAGREAVEAWRQGQAAQRTYAPWTREDGTLTVAEPPLERAKRKALTAAREGKASALLTLEEWRAVAYEVTAQRRYEDSAAPELNRHNLTWAGVKLELP